MKDHIEFPCPVCGKDKWRYNWQGRGIFCAECAGTLAEIGVSPSTIRILSKTEKIDLIRKYLLAWAEEENGINPEYAKKFPGIVKSLRKLVME